MIAPLRRRHRWMTAILALAVPVLYVVALAGRTGEPIGESLPATLAQDPPSGELIQDYGALFTGQPIAARLRGDGASWWIELEPREPITRPEVLVYWARQAASPPDRLPPDAFLLGALAGTRARAFALPTAALGTSGHLLLYSLGHQEIVASTPLPAVAAPPPGQETAVPGGEAVVGDPAAAS